MIFVGNEVGLGGISDNKMGREFQDLAGLVNQHIAAQAQAVYFIAAGLPLQLKPTSS